MEILGLVDVPGWVLTTIAVLIFSIWYNFSMYTHFKKYNIDGPTPLPFVGTLLQSLWVGFLKNERQRYKQYKDKKVYGSFFFTGTPSLTVMDPTMMKEILVKNFHKCANRTQIGTVQKPLDKMMTVLRDDHWKHIRGMTTPTFTTGRLKNMMTLIKNAADLLHGNMVKAAENKEEVDLRDYCGNFTMDVVASTMFGIQVDSQKDTNDPFVVNAKEIFNFSVGSPKAILFILFPKLATFLVKYCGVNLFPQAATKFFERVCDQALEQRKETPGKFHDFLDIMIKEEVGEETIDRETKLADGTPLKWSTKGILKDEIISQAIIFFLAGYDTTGLTLHYLFYHMAIDQEIQDKVFQEIDEVLGDEDLTYDKVGHLEYLDMCIQETLRMYPPAFRFDRLTSEEMVVEGITIPKGTSVGFPAYAIHFDPEIYPEPEKFNPMRFTAEEKAARNLYHWMPFGMGPRNCIGMRLALLEIKYAASAVLRKCRIVRAPSTPDPQNIKMIPGSVRPKPPIKVLVELRQ